MGKIFFPLGFTKKEKPVIISRLKGKCTGGSMDRASDSGSEGWGFESLPVYQIKEEDTRRVSSSFISPSGREGTRKTKCECPVDIRLPPVSTAATPSDVPLWGTSATSPFRCTLF